MSKQNKKIPRWRTGSSSSEDEDSESVRKTSNWRYPSSEEEDSEVEVKKAVSSSSEDSEVEVVKKAVSSSSEDSEEDYPIQTEVETVDEEQEDLSFKFSEQSFLPLPDTIVGVVSSYITGEDIFEFLTEGFYSKTNIPHIDLDLSDRAIDVGSLVGVCNDLCFFKSLTLTLSGTANSPPTYMAKLAPKIKSLTIFNLNDKNLSWLALCPLVKLDIKDFSGYSLDPFRLFPSLQEISIYQYLTELKSTTTNNNIRKLTINCYRGGGLNFISNLSNLEELYLSTGIETPIINSDIEDMSVDDLKLEECQKLKKVGIYGFNALTDLEFISKLPLLEAFNYKGSAGQYDDEIPPVVVENTSLREVNIEGFYSTEYSFKGCPNLESLVLNVGCLLELDLPKSSSLERLVLENSKQENLNFLADCPQLKEFIWQNTEKQLDLVVSGLRYCTLLENLLIKLSNHSTLISEEVISKLSELKTFGCSGFSSDMKFLSPCLNLENLNISCIEKVDLSFLAPLTKLSDLTLQAPATNIRHLANCTNIKHLDISTSEIDMSFLSKLVNLKFLHLHKCCRLNSLKFVSTCLNLTRLEIVGAYKLLSISGLERCTKLKDLSVKGSILRNISKLEYCTSLESLSLDNTDVEDISILLKCTRLNTLELSDSKIKNLAVLKNTGLVFVI